MKLFINYLYFLVSFSLQAQSLTFGPTTVLFDLDGEHWELSQPMLPVLNADGKHIDFYGLTGSTYRKHSYTAGNYPSKEFMLFGDFNYITDVHDYDGDGKDDILTDYDIFRNSGNNVYERYPFGNISFEVEGSMDYDGDGLRDVIITEDDFISSRTSLYVFKNKGNFVFEKIIVEQNKNRILTTISADINGDKRDDIIAATSSDVIPFVIFLSNADGTFTTREIKGNDQYYLAHTLSVRDMDKDGDLDLVVMDYEKGLWFFENQDNFMTSVRRKDTSFDPVINGLMVHCDDLNGDGWPEMIVGTLTSSRLTIQVSKGTGSFEFDALQDVGFVQGGTSDFAPQGRAITRMLHTIDINADNKKDIVLTSTFDKKQVAWLNNSIISSTEDIVQDEAILFPNPATDIVHITDLSISQVLIKSISGQVILNTHVMPGVSIDVSHLTSGWYIAELIDNRGNIITQKLVIYD